MGSRLRENESEEHHPDFKEDRSFCEAQAIPVFFYHGDSGFGNHVIGDDPIVAIGGMARQSYAQIAVLAKR